MLIQPALAGIVPRKNLWPLIQRERWYHVPAEAFAKLNIADAASIKYIAFYFAPVFDVPHRCKVMYYAKVARVDIKKRIELFSDEPANKNASANYYQFHLGEIEKLPRPIACQRQRKIIHILSDTQKLFTAEEINDLWSGNPLEDLMYQALKKKKIEVERQFFVEAGEEKYYLDFAIFCRRGKIDVECDGAQHFASEFLDKDRRRNNLLASAGWYVLRFSNREINSNIKNCIDIVQKTIANLGGWDETKDVLD